jgi:4-methyl-5(b-hydroxyethyl)-thiazole monophosphate biosynthesis
MPQVLLPLAEGFEEIEALAVIDVLRRADIRVVIAGLAQGAVRSARNVSVIPDTTIDTINVEQFDMIILPGGKLGTENLNNDPRIHNLLVEFQDTDKLIGAICGAPTVLAAAGIIAGKRVTSHPNDSSRLGDALYADQSVVIDGNIITSQGAGTAISFALAIVSRLMGVHAADTVSTAILAHESDHHDIWDQRLFNSTIQALVSALEMKDTYTQGHAKRVTELSLSIGAKLIFDETEMRDLYLGAILHDIGKIGTADDVLNKPDSLSLREETLVREHPLKGTLFIVGIENLSHIVPVILHHHERWDGTGYPGHLKGEQIPLHARIVCVADAYDAMLTKRSYHEGLDKKTAMVELQKEKGFQFDPFLVDVLIECLNDSPYEMKDFSYYF